MNEGNECFRVGNREAWERIEQMWDAFVLQPKPHLLDPEDRPTEAKKKTK